MTMLVPSPLVTAVWPDVQDVPDLLAIVNEQADTIADQAALIDRYQAALNVAQAGPQTATGIGTSTGTSLAMTQVNGVIAIGDRVSGPGFATGTYVTAAPVGGGNGTYTTNIPSTAVSAALAFIPQQAVATGTGTGTGTSLVMTNVNGTIVAGVAGSVITGAGVPMSTTAVNQTSGTTGGNGTYTTSAPTTANAAPLAFTNPPIAPTWPVPQDQTTLMALVQDQTALLRTQAASIQHYQDILNTSQTPAS